MAPEFKGRFDPIELSDAALEHDGLRHLTFHSPALNGRGDVSIFIPRGTTFPTTIPLVVLLHGVYGSHWAWFLKAAVHRTAQTMIDAGEIHPTMIATPSDGLRGDGSGYLPYAGCDYERWIAEDVPACVREQFPSEGPVFLGGLSMGGYGALRLGFKYPERFAGISAHSSITKLAQMRDFVRDELPLDQVSPQEHDLLHWVKKHRTHLPPLRFDCGREDSLFSANEELDRDLTAIGVPHAFEANPGAHTWPYWAEHIRDSLRFFDSLY